MSENILLEYGVAGLVAVFGIWVIKEVIGFFKSKTNGNGNDMKQVLEHITNFATEQRDNAIKESLSKLVSAFEKHISTDCGIKDALEKVARAVENSNMIATLIQERMKVHDNGASARHTEIKTIVESKVGEIKTSQEKCRRECKEEHEKLEAISAKK